MRKKKFFTKARIAVILVATITFWGNIKAQSPPPDTIRTPTELAGINSSGNYVLGNDIDLSTHNGGIWIPIAGEFSGNLDGNGYVIKNLKIITPVAAIYYGGLFMNLGWSNSTPCMVKNLILEDVDIDFTDTKSSCFFGVLAGRAHNGANIVNCSVSGSIKVAGCGSSCIEYYVGGLIGNVTSDNLVNGTGAVIDQCFSTASIHVKDCKYANVGGLIGIAQGGARIHRCYAVSDITLENIETNGSTGGANMGGLIGRTWLGGSSETVVSECYAAGTLKALGTIQDPSFGGLIGIDPDRDVAYSQTKHTRIENCYYDETKAGTYISGGIPHIVGLPQGLTDYPFLLSQTNTPAQSTANMKQESTFTGWNFTPVSGHWSIDAGGVINDGYPVLQKFYSNSADLLEGIVYVFDTVEVHITDGNYPVKIYYSVEDPNNAGTWINPAVANFPYPIEITSGYIAKIRTTKVGTFNFRLDSIVDAVITVHPPQVIEQLTVLPRPLAWVSHTDIKPQSYTGNPICPIVTLIDTTVTPPYNLIEGTDYTVSCANNIKVCDNATITFVMQNYTGTFTLPFKIKHDCGQDTIWDISSMLVAIKDVEMEDAVNGKNYPTVRIGCDCWTTKNFEGESDANGNPVANMIHQSELYPDIAANLAAFGRLYTYDAATLGGMSAQGICPTGWRLPTSQEWNSLRNYDIADLKLAGNLWWLGQPANNGTGLSLVPGGLYRNDMSRFELVRSDAFYWSYDLTDDPSIVRAAWCNHSCFDPNLSVITIPRQDALSVRCVKD
jgi:uncharacterized protein (TIGR02145 family)